MQILKGFIFFELEYTLFDKNYSKYKSVIQQKLSMSVMNRGITMKSRSFLCIFNTECNATKIPSFVRN